MKLRRLALAVVGIASLISTAVGGELRSWTSRDGTATMDASFHKVEGERVTLLLANGRAQYVERTFLSESDLAWIDEQSTAATATANSVSADAKIPAALAGNLLDDRGNPASIANADGSAPKYYLFYYSASWCGPCKAFTPELVRFYKRMKSSGTSLAAVLVPSDKSREDEVAYLKDHRMPWPGVDFDKSPVRAVPDNTSGYIPSMVLADADGKVLLEVGKSLNRDEFLNQAKDILTASDDVASR